MNTSDYRFILKTLVTYTMTNSDDLLFGSGTFYVTKNTTISLTMNSLMTLCRNEFNNRYAEVAGNIVTDDDNMIQHIDNLVKQQIAVIQESIRHLNIVEDFVHPLKNL